MICPSSDFMGSSTLAKLSQIIAEHLPTQPSTAMQNFEIATSLCSLLRVPKISVGRFGRRLPIRTRDGPPRVHGTSPACGSLAPDSSANTSGVAKSRMSAVERKTRQRPTSALPGPSTPDKCVLVLIRNLEILDKHGNENIEQDLKKCTR